MDKQQKIELISEILESNAHLLGDNEFGRMICLDGVAEKIIDALEQQRMNRVVLESGNHMMYGETVQTDHTIKTFEVSIRTMGRITSDGIKDYLEQKHEVVSIEEIDTLHVVRKR